MPKYTLDELIDCVKREVRMRRRVYPGMVREKKMDQAEADREIGMMQELADMLRKKRSPELNLEP